MRYCLWVPSFPPFSAGHVEAVVAAGLGSSALLTSRTRLNMKMYIVHVCMNV